MEKCFWLVSEGVVEHVDSDAAWDGETGVLVYSEDEQSALQLARRHDSGELELSNIQHNGSTVVALVKSN